MISISIIVPLYNNAGDLFECLFALDTSCHPDSEIIVVDDGSTDDITSVAMPMGVRLLHLAKNSGPSAARNHGALHARGDVLFFVDADMVVAPGAVSRVLTVFAENPDLAAVFGSYDLEPRAKNVVSQYRNLLHHFVHQNGNPDASTFWAGCGAIRRSVFEQIGGFDEKRFPRASIEDIELGYRLRQAGHRVLLDKSLQGTHLKTWTLRSLVWTDVFYRAVPWSRLIIETKNAPNDLNLQASQRLSLALVSLAGIFVLLAVFRIELLGLSVAALFGVIVLNRKLYIFFFRRRGFLFAVTAVLLHLFYYLYSGLSYLCVWIKFWLARAVSRPPTLSREDTDRSVQTQP